MKKEKEQFSHLLSSISNEWECNYLNQKTWNKLKMSLKNHVQGLMKYKIVDSIENRHLQHLQVLISDIAFNYDFRKLNIESLNKELHFRIGLLKNISPESRLVILD